MITTVSLNPSVDRAMTVASFQYGGMNRVTSLRSDAGGKAVNVSIAAAALGVQTECIGLLYYENGRTIENRLLLGGVGADFIWMDGRVRTNIKLLDASRGVVTEINEPGAPVNDEILSRVTELVCAHAQDSDFLVLSGSLPPGCPADYYRTLIEAVEGLDCRCVLDAEGEALSQGLLAHPFLIKPNQRELEIAVGAPLESIDEIKRAARSFIERGVEIVAVSMGDKGALIANREETLFAPKLDVQVKSTVGAGDSMVAGLVAAFLREESLEDAFRQGVACASACVMNEGTILLEHGAHKPLLDRILIQKV